MAKLLSPFHNKESISLNSEYTEFLKRKSDNGDPEATKLLKSQFKGFISNRFGRLGELSSLFILHKGMITSFLKNR